ncbi:hypothetical protein SBRCBS47491_004745 [Sporothrix bragantina]|uniref:Uncharacterized protein n=1 Tax=Sporothrix bragantina TaxID=671064 RepID=A0ABP0BRC1_9PEZI
MTRQKHKRWWPAGLVLPLLLTTAFVTAAAAEPETQHDLVNVGSIFQRIAAPVAAAVAAPNVLAANADEQANQMVQALLREQERRERREAKAQPEPAKAARQPLQTPPPSLAPRQNDDSGQIAALSAQIQSISLVASSISQASRSVSQTSQQLAQQVTQLSQSTDRLSQSINSLQNSAQQAQQSAQSAQQAAQQASQSATQAISQAVSSAQSSANNAISSAVASASSSASVALAAAAASAANLVNAAASQVQSAQADATIARADAATQVQQAQGTAVSVTQAALAIVGAFVGSSLLTILAFYLVLRYKTNRKRRRTRLIATRGDIGYPKVVDSDDDNGGKYGYPIDLKDPPRKSVGGGGGTGEETSFEKPEAAYLRGTGGPPNLNKGSTDSNAGFGFAAFGSGSGSSMMTMGAAGAPAGRKDSVPINGRSSFSLFPKTPPTTEQLQQAATQPAAPSAAQVVVSPSIYATGTSAMTSNTLARAAVTNNNPTRAQPSLQQWLREGTVSPFGTLKRDSTSAGAAGAGAAADANGPSGGLDRKQQQLRAMMKRSIGVGGVNAGGGGRVMQPGGSLPLRNN